MDVFAGKRRIIGLGKACVKKESSLRLTPFSFADP